MTEPGASRAVVAEPARLVFAGTPEFAAVALEALVEAGAAPLAVYTQPDRPAGRGRKLTASPVKLAALRYGIPLRQPLTLKDPAEQHALRELSPDLMIVAAYGLILPAKVLAIPRRGCVNIHASLLPRWRGAAPIQRAILSGDRETGVTLMQMDRGLDTGAMLVRVSCPITAQDTAQTLHDRLAVLGAETLVKHLDALVQGSLAPVRQDEALATYAAKLDKSESALDWRRSARELELQVRAFNPWPVACTTLEGEILRVWEARALEETASPAEPGTIIRAGRAGIDVASGQGTLRLLRVQLAGGRPLPAADFLNARSVDALRLGHTLNRVP